MKTSGSVYTACFKNNVRTVFEQRYRRDKQNKTYIQSQLYTKKMEKQGATQLTKQCSVAVSVGGFGRRDRWLFGMGRDRGWRVGVS